LVRPYTLTAGRTASHVDLSLETPISTAAFGPAPRWPANDVRADILRLAGHSLSVAEIAAHLSLPLGVARVLIGDLVSEGYLRTHVTLATANVEDRRELIGRTLRGLRAL
jgi:predicted transcriptional regulator